ncbi:MAG TPA: hypothetical protein VLI05_02725 [Candidatus Saccharimonadia bacterium]|nr:hypothetical protein [Candidatus Saccharimonadia bacterium]
MQQLQLALQPVFAAALGGNLRSVTTTTVAAKPYGTSPEPAFALALALCPEWLNVLTPMLGALKEALRQCGINDA